MQSSFDASGEHLPASTGLTLLVPLLRQVQADLADPAVWYLLAGHYYERTNHPRYRHYPAVFALEAGEVENFEVGPDFLAFDTEFIRYPERGEPHYPGPWTDRFRATVPFAQLYKLSRKVLTPVELEADQINYGPENVVYYNEAIHRQYPTSAEINQPYAAAPPSDEATLATAMHAVAVGLTDPQNHYLVNTTSFDSPAGPVMMGTLYLHADTAWNLEIGADEFTCDVLLNPRNQREKSRVRVGFGQVWQVLYNDKPDFDAEEVEENGGVLYVANHVLSAFAQQGRPS